MTTQYDKELKEIGHYTHYKETLPFIGKNYENTKLLLIGESYQIPPESKVKLDNKNDYEKWYEKRVTLISADKEWINFRNIIEIIIKKAEGENKSLTMQNLTYAFKMINKSWNDLAYVNTFQRPAGYGDKRKNFIKIDNEKARDVINKVVRILNPKFIGFVSAKAWKTLWFYENVKKITDKNKKKFTHPSRWTFQEGVKFSEWLKKCFSN